MQAPPVSQQQIQQLLQWLAKIPFTRPKRNISRDFSDGVLVAQIFKKYYPNLIQLHNYQLSNSSSGKYINWKTLNQKVFKKIGFQIHKNDIENIINIVPGTAQKVLFFVYQRINQNKSEIKKNTDVLSLKKIQIKNNSEEDQQLSLKLADKQDTIRQLRDTIQILQAKMKKMEQLSKLKDAKIDSLLKKIQEQLIQ